MKLGMTVPASRSVLNDIKTLFDRAPGKTRQDIRDNEISGVAGRGHGMDAALARHTPGDFVASLIYVAATHMRHRRKTIRQPTQFSPLVSPLDCVIAPACFCRVRTATAAFTKPNLPNQTPNHLSRQSGRQMHRTDNADAAQLFLDASYVAGSARQSRQGR
jgi:hypothetical protein